jgi:acyl-CoA synthetase (NDP forming)
MDDREPYGLEDLQPLLNPRSIAVVGASERPSSYGAKVVANLSRGSLAEHMHLVNPSRDSIDGRRCYRSVGEIDYPIDCAVLSVPADQVLGVLEECAEAGVRSALVYASGFAETGDTGADLQSRMSALARGTGMRICGPNALGFLNVRSRIETQFLPGYADDLVPGGIGIATQSGALAYQLLQAQYRGIGFSYAMMCGNACDVDVVDMLNVLVEDPATRVAATVFESVQSGDRLALVAERARQAQFPILAMKLGSGTATSRATMSHTGSLAGSDRAFRAAFDRYGLVTVDDLASLVEAAQFFAMAGVPRTEHVAVVSTSGGGGVVTAQTAESLGLSLPQPLDRTREALTGVVPPYASVNNPVDMTSTSTDDATGIRTCLDAFGGDEQYGVVVFPQTVAGEWITTGRAELLGRAGAAMAVPLAVVWMSEWLEGPGSATLDAHPDVALFRSARRCFETVKAWHEWSRTLGGRPPGPTRQDSSGLAEHAAEKLRVLARERLSASPGQTLLDESESFELFGAAGISCPRHTTATSTTTARTACAEVGFPAVMKILSDKISHKSNAGGVILHIGDEAEAAAAYRRLWTTFGSPEGGVDVLVEEEISHAAELIVGIKRDVHFGRTVVVGVGGTDVERTDVTMVDLLPVDEERLGGFLLGAGIATSAVSPQAVCRVLSGLNAIMNSCENVAEIDINPLVVDESAGTSHRLVALDGVVVLRDVPVDDNGSATGRRHHPEAH